MSKWESPDKKETQLQSNDQSREQVSLDGLGQASVRLKVHSREERVSMTTPLRAERDWDSRSVTSGKIDSRISRIEKA
jgi:hypothetical protein